MKKIFGFLGASLFFLPLFPQDVENGIGQNDLNTITTAVPFLLIAPDSRSGAMGDVGVATTADLYS